MTHVHRYICAPQNGYTAKLINFVLRLVASYNCIEIFVNFKFFREIKIFLERSHNEWDPWVIGE